jgi:hypothetical protein
MRHVAALELPRSQDAGLDPQDTWRPWRCLKLRGGARATGHMATRAVMS